jgi:hypothetical protein
MLIGIDMAKIDEMTNLKDIFLLSEAFRTDEFFAQHGMKIVDEKSIHGYDLVLLKFMEPMGSMVKNIGLPIYQLGLEKKGMDFTNINQQVDKTTFDPRIQYLAIVREMKNAVGNWIDTYGTLALGSYDERKNERYRSLLEKLGFHCEKINTSHMLGIDVITVFR